MSDKPIYLTSKRLMYNMAKVDFRYGRISEQELNRRKSDWEAEYKNDKLQAIFEQKYNKGN